MKRSPFVLRSCFLSLLCVFSTQLVAQLPEVRPTKREFFYFQVHGAFGLTSGDFAKRVEQPKAVGAGFGYKWKSNVSICAEWNFLFGTINGLKSDLNPFLTPDTFLINNEGILEDPIPNFRGYSATVRVQIPLWTNPKQPNSSVFLSPAFGWGYHYIYYRVEDARIVALLSDEYEKGFDKLRKGFLVSTQIGYDWRSNSNLRNFKIAYEFQSQFSKSGRQYSFDNITLPENQIELTHSLRLSWNLPFTSTRIVEEGILY